MNTSAEIGISLPSNDYFSALKSSMRALRSSTSPTTNTPPVVYMILLPNVPVEERNSADGSIILDICELRKQNNKDTF